MVLGETAGEMAGDSTGEAIRETSEQTGTAGDIDGMGSNGVKADVGAALDTLGEEVQGAMTGDEAVKEAPGDTIGEVRDLGDSLGNTGDMQIPARLASVSCVGGYTGEEDSCGLLLGCTLVMVMVSPRDSERASRLLRRAGSEQRISIQIPSLSSLAPGLVSSCPGHVTTDLTRAVTREA